ncbi:methyltransferase [Abeliophyllum distichum]|uniref:Methyltransferase n=1 Tax=Abeliophyllum distichum TaxID=126358 RepID=A0ABD1P935_9LAMI
MGDLARGCRAKNGLEMNELNAVGMGLNSDTLLIIKLPDARVLRIMSRSFFLAMVLLTLPSLGSILRASSVALYESDTVSDVNGFKVLPILFRDLVDEGLIKMGHKGLIAGAGDIEDDLDFLKEIGIDLITESDLHRKKITQNEMFNFVFALSFRGIKKIDGVLKNNGIVIAPLGNDPSNDLHLQKNYRIVYLRRYENTVVAMRKSGASTGVSENSPAKQISCGTTLEAKKDALKGLEDVYLEPPRRALAQSTFRSRKIKFLPDLLKDSLENYPRRIFIADESSALDWFYKNYPMRDQQFEIFNIELKSNEDESSRVIVPQETGISAWLTMNVKNEDYVVMKAEAQVVEDMLKEKTICLVDELFLECKNQWQEGEVENGSKRAYWQCLALYGKLKDEGVAVHQW